MRAVKQTPVISGTKSTAMTKEEILEIRNDLYESIPTGKVDAFPLIRLISNHIDKLDALIEGATQEKQGWVKTLEAKPEREDNFLVITRGTRCIRAFSDDEFIDADGIVITKQISHWRELPQKPEV